MTRPRKMLLIRENSTMKQVLILALLCTVGLCMPLGAQQLPGGTYQPNRERSYDLIHLAADLRIDWGAKKINGEATLRLRPLGALSRVSLDAYRMTILDVQQPSSSVPVKYSISEWALDIDFGRMLDPTDTVTILVRYATEPTAGLYFVHEVSGATQSPSIFTYGEGGINANWLPLYAAPNDKFTSEMTVTVVRPFTALSNGRLLETRENADGTRTFHWRQELPHSDYLLALFVGEYVPIRLRPAFGTIPVTCWVPPGREQEGQEVFQRTPEMIEFFSNRFSYRYPWEKYDQVSAYDYAIGAMENTNITGHNDRILRKPGQASEFGPTFDSYTEPWSAEAIISHELAHHWFGDNTTYRSLASLWLNESFATLMMMLWDEHRLGKDDYEFQTWLALQAYLRYVQEEHIIRPLEYRYFDSRSEIYNEEHTYLKGAIVLDMLRWILGDDAFFQGMSAFLHKHEFANVESPDLKIALEESTGQNLSWFFDQWVYGGGHPIFEAETIYLPQLKKIKVTIKQVQPFVVGQGLFALPIEIRVDAGGKTTRTKVWINNEEEEYLLEVPQEPDMVSIDGIGRLVSELRHAKGTSELVYQATHDDLSGRLWAIRKLVEHSASDPQVLETLKEIFASNVHWSLKAEGTLLLKNLESKAAEELLLAQLKSQDYHVRKAAVIALGSRFTSGSRSSLRSVIEKDRVDDVAATAIVALARVDPSMSADYLKSQAEKKSWYDVRRIAVLQAIALLGRPELASIARDNVSDHYNYQVRSDALKAWAACSAGDPELATRLIDAARGEILPVREEAMALLGQLKIEQALPVLEELAARNGDSDVRNSARTAIDKILRGEIR